MESNETPQEKRERLRQNELKGNAAGSFGDGFNRGQGGSLTDLAGDMGWKGMGLLILVLFFGYVLYRFFFS